MDFQPSGATASSCLSKLRQAAALLSVALLGFVTACGGSGTGTGGGTGTTPPPPAANTTVQINLGDAPADWMLAFSTSITSMSLTGNNGSVNVTNASTPIEMTQLMGTMEPLAMVSAPQGTYSSASITLGNCSVTYIDPTTKTMVQKTIQGPFSTTVTFSSPITVGSTPMAFNFDLDLASSVAADNSGNLSFTPKFDFSMGTQGAGSSNDPADGGMQEMMGTISNVTSGSFTMTPLQSGQSFDVTTNSATQFQGIASGMGKMGSGMGVLVTATLQPNGTLLATRIASMMQSGGIMGGGIITGITGQPATQLGMVVKNGAGAGMMASYFSQNVTVNLDSTTQFAIEDSRIDLSNLPFTPTFDANHIFVGQSVMPIDESGGMMSGGGMGGGMMGNPVGSIAASNIYLEEQGFRGTTDTAIEPGTAASFTLTLDPQCAFTSLTGAGSILVEQQSATVVEDNTSIAAGSIVRVHGLLFQNDGQWTMVASRIATR